MCVYAHTCSKGFCSVFLSKLQLSSIPQRHCLESACRAGSSLPLRCGTLHMYHSLHSDLPTLHNATLSARGQDNCETAFPFSHAIALLLKEEELALLEQWGAGSHCALSHCGFDVSVF